MDSVHLLGKNETPLGVLTRPPRFSGRSELAVVFLNSGLLHRVGPFRLYVTLARRLAELGVPCLRIDQSGKGDSARRSGLSFDAAIKEDFLDAADFLRANVGARKFVVLGLCSGADDALYLASQSPDVVGAILLEPYAARTFRYYVRHYGPRVLRFDLWAAWAQRAWCSGVAALRSLGRREQGRAQQTDMGAIREVAGYAEMRRRYQSILDRGGRLLCVFTDGARSYYNYVGQLVESMNLGADADLVSELYLPEAKHTYPLAPHREQLINAICAWMRQAFPDVTGPLRTEPAKQQPPTAVEQAASGSV